MKWISVSEAMPPILEDSHRDDEKVLLRVKLSVRSYGVVMGGRFADGDGGWWWTWSAGQSTGQTDQGGHGTETPCQQWSI